MIINNVEVNVLRGVDEVPLKEYGNEGRTFIEAKDGFEYSLRIRNNNPWRVMVVASVDGLSVLDGKLATKYGNGYVLNGYDKLNIKGYRKNNDEVGAFKFVKKSQSYASEKGEGQNVGIISVAVFKEKQYNYAAWINNPNNWNDGTSKPIKPWWEEPKITWTCSSNPTFKGESNVLRSCNVNSVNLNTPVNAQNFVYCSAINASVPLQDSVESFAAGSTWGQKIQDKVVEVSFEKESNCPCAEFNIFYDFRAGLEKLGIKFTKETQINFPQGFPGKFCEPPSGWKS